MDPKTSTGLRSLKHFTDGEVPLGVVITLNSSANVDTDDHQEDSLDMSPLNLILSSMADVPLFKEPGTDLLKPKAEHISFGPSPARELRQVVSSSLGYAPVGEDEFFRDPLNPEKPSEAEEAWAAGRLYYRKSPLA